MRCKFHPNNIVWKKGECGACLNKKALKRANMDAAACKRCGEKTYKTDNGKCMHCATGRAFDKWKKEKLSKITVNYSR